MLYNPANKSVLAYLCQALKYYHFQHKLQPLRAKEDVSPRRVVHGRRGLSSRTELPESQRSQASEVSDAKLSSASSQLRAEPQCASVHAGIGDEDGRGHLAVASASSILGMDEQNLSRGSDTTDMNCFYNTDDIQKKG